MKRSNKSGLLLTAVLAGCPIFGGVGVARGQFQVGSGGHAHDASNRVGSGGINPDGNSGSTNGFSNNNNVFTGNVSGLNYFHGGTRGIFDSNTVNANTESGASDQLNRISAPANGNAPQAAGGNYQQYYAASRVTTPPPNTVAAPNGAGYMPAPRINPAAADADSRLGNVNLNNTTNNLLPAPGEMDMAGPVDPSGAQSLYTMSPLYGVRKNDSSDAGDSYFLSQYSNYRQTTPRNRSRLDPTALRHMQEEINGTGLSADQQNPSLNTNGNNNPAEPTGNAKPGSPGTINTGQGNQLQSGALNSGEISGQTLSSRIGDTQVTPSIQSGQGTQNRILIPAGRQSAQLQALEKKFAGQKLTDVESSQLFNEEHRLLALANSKKKMPGKNAVDPASGTTGTPGKLSFGGIGAGIPSTPAPRKLSPVLNGQDNTADNQPYVITSLATGIKAKGLADLLKSAEDQMRSGKFSQAIDTYDTAQEVAPNNPFVPLGRGFAELGRSYYARADADITRAITAEPALLAGQYDLKGFIGEDRVRFIQKDLHDIAGSEKGARAPVLLAYIAHNTGDDTVAAKQLDEASTRGGYNSVIDSMRQAWGIKATTPSPK